MKKEQFYSKYANVLLNKRFSLLSNDFTSPILGMTLSDVYTEIKLIDNKLRRDEIRREELLHEVEKYL